MKKILAIAAVVFAAVCFTSCKGQLDLCMRDMTDIKVNEQFSFFNYLEIRNDFDGVVKIDDIKKWAVVADQEITSHLEHSGIFWTVDAPCSGSVYMIYDKDGMNIRSNEVRFVAQ